jgi:hypothetical protein
MVLLGLLIYRLSKTDELILTLLLRSVISSCRKSACSNSMLFTAVINTKSSKLSKLVKTKIPNYANSSRCVAFAVIRAGDWHVESYVFKELEPRAKSTRPNVAD